MLPDYPAQKVRDFALRTYIGPAQSRNESTVRIQAGDVHKALGFHNRFPLVCSALSGDKFLKPNGLALVNREGPPSGNFGA